MHEVTQNGEYVKSSRYGNCLEFLSLCSIDLSPRKGKGFFPLLSITDVSNLCRGGRTSTKPVS